MQTSQAVEASPAATAWVTAAVFPRDLAETAVFAAQNKVYHPFSGWNITSVVNSDPQTVTVATELVGGTVYPALWNAGKVTICEAAPVDVRNAIDVPEDGKRPACNVCGTRRHAHLFWVTTDNAWTGDSCSHSATVAKAHTVCSNPLEFINERVNQGQKKDRTETLHVIAEARAIIETRGYVSIEKANAINEHRGGFYTMEEATVDRLHQALNYEELSDGADLLSATMILLWAREDFVPKGDFEEKLAYVASLDTVGSASVGLLAYLTHLYTVRVNVPSYTTPPVAAYAGELGDTITATVTVTSTKEIDTQYGRSTIVTTRSDTDHVIVWFTSNEKNIPQIGETVTVRGFVKKTSTFQDVCQTQLNRVKRL
jgi:hypothetical protein